MGVTEIAGGGGDVAISEGDGWRLCVAPMMDWTDRHCRYFHRILAPSARLYTEMVHANAVLQGDRHRLLAFDCREHPVALQIGGSQPAQLAEAARIGEQWGYDEINLNVGCPSDRVQSGKFGACLMREPRLVAECVMAMVSAVAIPVTVKCRIGVDDQDPEQALSELVDCVAAAGCRVVIVHARKAWLQGLSPKDNREIPPLDYGIVFRLKQRRPDLLVVLNGGLDDSASTLLRAGSVDGVMLGRAAYHRPYLLHRLDAALSGRNDLKSRKDLLCEMEPYVREHVAAGGNVRHIARHLLGLFHGEPGGRQFRQSLSATRPAMGAGWELIRSALDCTDATHAAP